MSTTNDMNDLIGKIASGRAVLFIGAGFSVGTENVTNNQPALAKDLAKKICNDAGFLVDDDLCYVSDYYINKLGIDGLIEILKDNYTIKDVSEDHVIVGGENWRRVYTTNYDNSFELSANRSNKPYYSLSLEDKPEEFYKKNNICLHINGDITRLDRESLNNSFKLTRSSYVSPDSFSQSHWYYPFKKDLEQCSAMVFVGYSMYDIDIEKLLFSCPDFKEKIYFIISDSASEKECFVLSKYGKVFDIGVKGFANELNILKDYSSNYTEDLWFDCLVKYQLLDANEKDGGSTDKILMDYMLCSNITDNEIADFMLTGKVIDKYIDEAILNPVQDKPYMVVRGMLEEIIERIARKESIVIYGELGNGKTVLSRQISSKLTVIGKDVYNVVNSDGNYIADIEKIHSLKRDAVIIVDNYSQYLDMVEYLKTHDSGYISYVLIDRTYEHERMRSFLKEKNITAYEYNVDKLTDKEILKFVGIIDNIGYWESRVGLSNHRKISFIAKDCDSELSMALLRLFDSPQIKERIAGLLRPILSNSKFERTIFAICLIEFLNYPLTYSLISEVAGDDEIYKNDIRALDSFRQLYDNAPGKIKSKSSLFSIAMLRSQFTSVYITNSLLGLVARYDKKRHCGGFDDLLFKNLLRFHFVERVMPDKNKINSMIKYYEELKVRVGWLKNDTHYWLQYGMARIMFGEYDKAQTYIDQAYYLANNKINYYTQDIDTQQARLYLLRALKENTSEKIFSYFTDANALLMKIENNIYKFRRVVEYIDIYDHKYQLLSKKHKTDFIHLCQVMLRSIQSWSGGFLREANTETEYGRCIKGLSEIIENKNSN